MLKLDDIVPLRMAELHFPDSHPLAGQRGVVFAFALNTADGVVLLDTGMGSGHAEIERLYRPELYDLDARLTEHGLRRENVVAVINCHLHFDHCGGNRRFPGVPVHVQAAEWEFAQQPHVTVQEWIGADVLRYVQLSGDAEVVPGIRVLATPGHTPGHQSVVVDTSDGTVVLVGQAIYSVREFEHIRATRTLLPGDPPPDAAGYLASALRLVDLDPQHVFFSHDAAVWHRPSTSIA